MMPNQSHPRSYRIWLIGVAFVLFQFFLQLSSGVIISDIMHQRHLPALQAGLLSSSLYFVYTFLQIPVGALLDRKSTRYLLTFNTALCSVGCFIFALWDTLVGLFVGRILIGAGAAFAFVGLIHLLREYYPAKKFAFMLGLSETLGFVGTTIGILSLGLLINHWGWNNFIIGAGLTGLAISYCCWTIIPTTARLRPPSDGYIKQIIPILRNGKMWVNGLYIGLSFTLVTVFGALWAVPFLQLKLACTLKAASWINAAFFLGTALSCPLFGALATVLPRRKPLILLSSVSNVSLTLLILFAPNPQLWSITGLMFLLGLGCGAYLLAYPIANELSPPGSFSTSTGFTNTLALIATPPLQLLIGYCIDWLQHGQQASLSNYQQALLLIPFFLSIAGILAYFLPEKRRIQLIYQAKDQPGTLIN